MPSVEGRRRVKQALSGCIRSTKHYAQLLGLGSGRFGRFSLHRQMRKRRPCSAPAGSSEQILIGGHVGSCGSSQFTCSRELGVGRESDSSSAREGGRVLLPWSPLARLMSATRYFVSLVYFVSLGKLRSINCSRSGRALLGDARPADQPSRLLTDK